MQDREMTFLLARPERRLLRAIATRLPGFIRPDHLTVLALAAAVAFAVAAATGHFWTGRRAARRALVRRLAGRDAGAGARAERPKYGYYVDHLADAAATALDRARPRARPRRCTSTAGLVLVVAYLALSINSYLEDARVRAVLARATGGSGRPRRGSR